MRRIRLFAFLQALVCTTLVSCGRKENKIVRCQADMNDATQAMARKVGRSIHRTDARHTRTGTPVAHVLCHPDFIPPK